MFIHGTISSLAGINVALRSTGNHHMSRESYYGINAHSSVRNLVIIEGSGGDGIGEHGGQSRQESMLSNVWSFIQFDSDLRVTWIHVLFIASIIFSCDNS